MGVFDRILGSVRGTADRLVQGLESSNPEVVYEAAIQARGDQLSELKRRAAGIVVQRDAAMTKVSRSETELAAVVEALHEAVREGDDDTALVLQMRSEELAAALEADSAVVLQLSEQSETIKGQLIGLKEEIASLKREQKTAVADLSLAQTRIDIQEATSGLSEEPSARALEAVRASIGSLEGLAEGDGTPLSAAADRKLKEHSARAQLAALKRQLAGDPEED